MCVPCRVGTDLGSTQPTRFALFPGARWNNLVLEKWRHESEPLERYAPSAKLIPEWAEEIFSYTPEQVEHARGEPIHLLATSAEKAA